MVAAALMVVSAPSARSAADPDSRPIPRVEIGSHAGFIKKLSVDREGRRLLTVSDDKTARIWDAATGRLIHVLRVPIENGHQGQLYAGAISPNGQIAAVGGFTSSFEPELNSRQAIVYFFNAATGALRSHQLVDSDAAIENLVFSPDGAALAVCLADGRGVRIYSLQHATLLRREDHTSDKILGTAFARNGDLAITTLDGKLWLFRAMAGYEKTVVELKAGRRPMHVQFSPDDTQLVVGYDGDPVYSIFDARSLKEIYVGSMPSTAGQHGLHVVEWSSDGEFIYAGGDTDSGFDSPIYRFSQHGHGTPEKLLTSPSRISDIRRLPNNVMAFTSGEPEVGVIEADGRVRWRNHVSSMDLRRMTATFRVSPAGNAVVFGAGSAAAALSFDVLLPVDSALQRSSVPPSQVAPAVQAFAGWDVSLSQDREHLMLNGKEVKLENRETVTTWKVAHGDKALLVGTSWSLRSYDHSGRSQWTTALAAEVEFASLSEDGHYIVAVLSDRTIRWYRFEDGEEILALFVSRNGQDWIAWIPSGYYMSSASGDNFMGWQVNQGLDRQPEFYRAVQFERILYRPDIVQAYFKARGHPPAADPSRGAGSFDIADLKRIAPPQLTITTTDLVTSKGQRGVQVHVSGTSDSLSMRDWSLFVNGIPVAASEPLAGTEQQSFQKEATIQLHAGLNQLRAESSNGRALGIAETTVESATEIEAGPGDLYIVAIGAGAFSDPAIRALKFAAEDASEVARVFDQLGKTGGFRATHTLLLADTAAGNATVGNIKASLGEFLAKARGADTSILFLASHGLSDREGNYYFVPADAKGADIKAVQANSDNAPTLLRWDFFVDTLRRTEGRRLLIVDTCSSGALGGTFDAHSLAKRSMSSSFALMAASRADEESQELNSAHHGLFTYGLLEALRTGYDPDHDGFVSLSEAFEYSFDKVQELRNRAVGQQTPQLNAPEVLLHMPLAVARHVTALQQRLPSARRPAGG